MESTAGLVTVGEVETIDDDQDDVAAFLAGDPELHLRLPKIEERVLHHFGPEARLERTVFHPQDEQNPEDRFFLRVVTDLSFDEKIDRLKAVLREEDELLAPVRPQLTIDVL